MGNERPKGSPPENERIIELSERTGGSGLTGVDLGDDLLEHTAENSDAPPSPVSSEPSSAEDQVQSARILIHEGLTDEAKKVLRRILFSDPRNALARAMLQEIQQTELKQLLEGGGVGGTRRKPGADRSDSRTSAATTDDVLQALDRDLELGLFDSNGEEREFKQVAIFGSPDELERFGVGLETAVADGSARDRIDLGVAFMEMGIHELAIRQFRAARRLLEAQASPDTDQEASSVALLARALLADRQAIEAVALLQPMVTDTGMRPSPADELKYKAEFLYLLGRAYECLGDMSNASVWYRKVRDIDPYYRDVGERIRRKKL